MSKTNELMDKKALVKVILKNDFFARNSDYRVFEDYFELADAPTYVVDAIKWVAKNYDGNIFETLSRARRKVQEVEPTLRANKSVVEERLEATNDYREFARK